MKKLTLIFCFSILSLVMASQVPQGVNYQAVAHTSSGVPISNTTIQVKVGILSDTLTPVVVWEELHSSVKTNSQGLFSLVIGTGSKQSGSAATFSEINWGASTLYLKVQVNYQNTWKYMGTSKLWSVPYALASGSQTDVSGIQTDVNSLKTDMGSVKTDINTAKTDIATTKTDLSATKTEVNAVETGAGLKDDGSYSPNASAYYIAGASNLKDADNKLDAQVKINSDNIATGKNKMVIRGTETSPDSALFRVVNKNGQTVFAVYNEGVRIYVDDGVKGAKGGFAIGGFGSAKAPSQDLFFVGADSIRAYINTDSQKGAKGGFAVGGFSAAKTPAQNLLLVSADSIRAYIDTGTGKGSKGGFAVGGFNSAKGTIEEYLRVTRDSTNIFFNTTTAKGAKGGFAVGGFSGAKGINPNLMIITTDSTNFYVGQGAKNTGSSFNILGANQKSLLQAGSDTVRMGVVLNVQNNITVQGSIGYTGQVTLISPDVQTFEVFNVSDISAMAGGSVISNGGAAVIASGVVWSTSPNPTDKLSTKTTDGAATGSWTSTITGLTPNTTYYLRAYATNSNGTGYGAEMTFTTASPGGTVTDYDGNVYNIVTIGSQTWTASNLKVTHLNDGTSITNITADTTWAKPLAGYSWYNNDAVVNAAYGILYKFNVVSTGLLCPTGWHVPTGAEWTTLQTFLGGSNIAGGKLKETGITHWFSPNIGATDEYGFKALPGGLRTYLGLFGGIGQSGNFWSSTIISVDATSASLNTSDSQLLVGISMTGMGLSVRCVQDAR